VRTRSNKEKQKRAGLAVTW